VDTKVPWAGKEHLIVEVRLTADGRWLYDGQEITHRRTVQAMHRGVERWTEGGRWDWIVRIGGQAYPVVIDDTPWLARSAKVVGGQLVLRLNTGEEVAVPADDGSIWVADDVVRSRLSDGREVRLLRTAQGDLADHLVDGNGDSVTLVVGDRRIPLDISL